MYFQLSTNVTLPFETFLNTPTPSEAKIKDSILPTAASFVGNPTSQPTINREAKIESPSPLKKSYVQSVILNISGNNFIVVQIELNSKRYQVRSC